MNNLLFHVSLLQLPQKSPVCKSDGCSDEAPAWHVHVAMKVLFFSNDIKDLLKISGLYVCTWYMENFSSHL